MAASKVLLRSLMNILQQEKCERCKIREILGLQREKCETCKIREIIQFCETILRKLESNEQLDQDENAFLEYISMVSQILGMTSDLKKLGSSINSNFEDYEQSRESLNRNSDKRFTGFMNFMNLSSCIWPSVSACGVRYKSSGGAQTNFRTRTQDDNHKIDITREEMKAEKLRSLKKFERISSKKDDFLKRLLSLTELDRIFSQKTKFSKKHPNLFLFVMDIIKMFELESTPEFSFFLSDFDQNHFKRFQYKFKVINNMFQLLKAEIDEFNRHVISEKDTCSRNIESICPIIHHENWKSASENFGTFYGKKD
jgi:hypothetical protein